MKFGTAVVYNGGEGKERQLAFYVGGGHDAANLIVLDKDGLAHKASVPERDVADYEEGGGGHTWHQVAN